MNVLDQLPLPLLVTDLDRPNMTLFELNQGLMVELEKRMEQQGSAGPGSVRP